MVWLLLWLSGRHPVLAAVFALMLVLLVLLGLYSMSY